MNLAIPKGMRTNRLVKIDKNLRDEIAHWLFLETWDDPLPWKEERHLQATGLTRRENLTLLPGRL